MIPVYAFLGDIFFTRSNSLLGRLIRWAETDPDETDETWANHTGVIVESGWIGAPDRTPQATVVEALWKVRMGPLDTSNLGVRVYTPVPSLSTEELVRFVATAQRFVDRRYGWWKLFFHLVDRAVFDGRKVLSRTLHVDDRPICSYLAAQVFEEAEGLERRAERVKRLGARDAFYAFGTPPEIATPDEMLDYCEASPAWRQR